MVTYSTCNFNFKLTSYPVVMDNVWQLLYRDNCLHMIERFQRGDAKMQMSKNLLSNSFLLNLLVLKKRKHNLWDTMCLVRGLPLE